MGENFREGHDVDSLQIVTSDGHDEFMDSMQSSAGCGVLMGL